MGERDQILKVFERGCPCSSYNPCCNGTSGNFTPDHECPEDEICEQCYVCECIDCGSSCACDL